VKYELGFYIPEDGFLQLVFGSAEGTNELLANQRTGGVRLKDCREGGEGEYPQRVNLTDASSETNHKKK
jgi:hypothetical protein